MGKENIAKQVICGIYDLSLRRRFGKKIRHIIRHQAAVNSWTDPPQDVIVRYHDLWKKLGRTADSRWLKVYGNMTGSWDHRFIPEDLYYIIAEPCLNNKSFSKSYTDKNLYSLFLKGFNTPEIIASNIEGVLYDNNLERTDRSCVREKILSAGRVIIKPSVDSGGGRNVSLWTIAGDQLVSHKGMAIKPEELDDRYGRNYVIQRVIAQHPFYGRFNSTSVNTVRMLTYRSPVDEEIHVLHTVLRVGVPGTVTDNQASGGFVCGVTGEGKLTGTAVDKHGNSFKEINGIRLEKGLLLEQFGGLTDYAKAIAGRFYYSRLLGLDLCVTEDGKLMVIEVNNMNNEINFFQMLNGPLFGEFTEEVASWCSGSRRSFMIDFDLLVNKTSAR